MATPPWPAVQLLGIDIDGTLTDGTLLWGGPDIGWTQRYAVRDGEAILRLVAAGVPVVPISRNKTACARARMQHLGLGLDWVGVSDKEAALAAVGARHGLDPAALCYVGDGREDAPLLSRVGVGVAVADAHPAARAAADVVTRAAGGCGAVEEVVEALLAAGARGP